MLTTRTTKEGRGRGKGEGDQKWEWIFHDPKVVTIFLQIWLISFLTFNYLWFDNMCTSSTSSAGESCMLYMHYMNFQHGFESQMGVVERQKNGMDF